MLSSSSAEGVRSPELFVHFMGIVVALGPLLLWIDNLWIDNTNVRRFDFIALFHGLGFLPRGKGVQRTTLYRARRTPEL